MIGAVKHVDWDSFDEAFPCVSYYPDDATYIEYRNRNCTWIYLVPDYESRKRQR